MSTGTCQTIKLKLVIDNPILLDVAFEEINLYEVFFSMGHQICFSSSKPKCWDMSSKFCIFSNSSSIRRLRFSVVLFWGWKRLKMLFFFFCLIVGSFVAVECRENVRSCRCLEQTFLSSWRLDSYTSISSTWQWNLSSSNVDAFLFHVQGGNP